MISNKLFEMFIIFMILASSILIILDDPLENPNSQKKDVLDVIDRVISIIFLIEAVLKIIALGFIFNGPCSYLRSLANVLDFFIVVMAMVSFDSSNNTQNFEKMKVLRIMRVLRPLRLISRNEGLKIAINSLIYSIPLMMNLLIVCFIFFLMFGIVGVNYFKGT